MYLSKYSYENCSPNLVPVDFANKTWWKKTVTTQI